MQGKSKQWTQFCQSVNQALHTAIENKNDTCAVDMIKYGANVWFADENGRNALMLASEFGLLKVVKAILER